MLRPLWIRFVLGMLVLYLGIWIYWPGLNGGFFFDDIGNILQPSGVRLSKLSRDALLDAWESGISGPLGRPMSMLTFAVNYYFSGFDPFVFKATNLLIHCVNSVLIYLLVGLLRKADSFHLESGTFAPFPLMVAALWFIHPIQLTSVLYVVQRMTSLAAMLVLMAVILHVWARQRPKISVIEFVSLFLAWGVLFPLAVLAKETALLFVPYILVYEITLHRSFRDGLDSFGKAFVTAVFVVSIFILLYLSHPDTWVLKGYEIRRFTLEERVLTEFRVVWAYIGLILGPSLANFGLYHDDFVISAGIFEPKTTLLAVCGLLALIWFSWRIRIRFPMIAFGLLWFLVGHSFESSVFPLELMHEHRNYLPSLGIFISLVALGERFHHVTKLKMVAPLLFIAFFFYSAILTSFRADMYGNDFRRTQIEAGYREGSVRSQYEAGALLVNLYTANPNQMLVDMAEIHFQKVNSLDATDKLALVGQLQIDCLSKRDTRKEIFEELRTRLATGKFLAMDRAVMNAVAEMSNVGTLCLTRDQVAELFKVAINNPAASTDDKSVMRSDHVLYLWEGQSDYPAAREVLLTAIDENSNDVLNAINLLKLSVFVGNVDDMVKVLRYLEGKQLKRQDQPIIQSIIHRLKAEGVSLHSPPAED